MDECWKQSVREQRTARELYGVLLDLAEKEIQEAIDFRGIDFRIGN